MCRMVRSPIVSAVLLLVLLAVICYGQQPVPTVTYADPIAGFSMQIPDDWEVATNDWGVTLIGLDAPGGASVPSTTPLLWFMFTRSAPQQLAADLAQGFAQLEGVQIQPRATGNGEEWEVSFVSAGAGAPMMQRWLCRREHGVNYLVAAFVRPEFAQAYAAEIDTALATCHLIRGPRVQRMREPTENAYRMLIPEGWRWEGQIIRTTEIPGYFQWKVSSPDGTSGAFNSPPGVFNIMFPYTPAAQCAQTWVLQGLAQQVPDVRLEAVHDQPRVGAHFCELIRLLRLGDNPRVHKVRADYLATVNGQPVRIRVNIFTFMFDASPLLGGAGNWLMFTSGAWAPVDQFDQLYPIGRGVLSSLATDPTWKDRQREAVFETTLWRKWVQRVFEHVFIRDVLDEDGRLELQDTINLPEP